MITRDGKDVTEEYSQTADPSKSAEHLDDAIKIFNDLLNSDKDKREV